MIRKKYIFFIYEFENECKIKINIKKLLFGLFIFV